ncbi:MAG: acetyl-CoA carboxylase biotin carboxyl carrier protein [Ruminococcus sp.]|nr:acetyl-CoA carboxylase biotin carboxyl carrier protein [Ruminococcus sp.]
MADNKTIACNLTLEDIESLAETLDKNKLERIKIKNGDSEIIIEAKRKCPPPPHHVPPDMPPMSPPPMNAAMISFAPAPEAAAPAVKEEKISGNVVKAPIVGTYYSAPSPEKAPFVKVGDTVKKGDVIMIIESMKLMNEVQSDFDGTVKKILVNNGQTVEYDQPIMIIE